MLKGNTGDASRCDHVISPLNVSPASVWLCSTNTGAPSLAGTSSLSLNCMKGWSSTTAPCSAHWIGRMLLRCFSSLTFFPPPFLPWKPHWLRRASPAAICSVSFSEVQSYGQQCVTVSFIFPLRYLRVTLLFLIVLPFAFNMFLGVFFVTVGLPSGGILSLPKMFLDPRRPEIVTEQSRWVLQSGSV